ncbi:MAG: hypothetical protein JXB09_02955 [Deltaproteobacteria bacterium]|nr:hypothetical protein [Deltaproteobacteria bacterium]
MSADGRAPARDRAIDDSMKRAVERILYLFISEDVAQENFDAINDNIYSKSQDYIQDYRILREGMDNDLYRVKVRATLSVRDIEDDLAMLGILTDERWPDGDATAVVVKIVVSGIEKYSHFRMLRETLETDIQGVDAVYLRRMESRVAVMDVDMQGNAAGLANVLAWREFGEFSLYITDVKPGVIDLNMVKE